MKKRILSFVIILVITLGFLPTVSFAANTTEFAGGSGTESDPYLISTKTHLNNVRNYLSAHFQMIRNIEFTDADFAVGGSFYNNGNGFLQIGVNINSAFKGTFDGNGYRIKNLQIKHNAEIYDKIGLFGYNRGVIKNLGIVGGNVTSHVNGSVNVGAIAGANAGTISKCYNTSIVVGYSTNKDSNGVNAGGIVGYNLGTIEKCYNKGKIGAVFNKDYANSGGIAGYSKAGKVVECYNDGTVSAEATDADVGGIVGYLKGGEVADCYNKGDTYSYKKGWMGGIVGLSTATVTRCYDIGSPASDSASSVIGAIIGMAGRGSTTTDCYHPGYVLKGVCSGNDTTTKCTYAQMREKSTYINFDFDNVWVLDNSVQETPMLKAFHTHKFSGACDTDCDICDDMREVSHAFGDYVYNNDANEKKDGTKTRTCSICGHKETVTATGTKWKSSFTDIKTKDFYYKPTLWAVANGITTGTSKTEFSPEEPCTRGQVVTFLWRAAGCPEPKTTTMPFTDVGSKAFYKKAVLWAVEQGVTSGTSATTFSPNETCTRGQIATFLWRAKGKPAPESSNMPFVDVKSKDFYYKAVQWAVENKITSGTSKTTFAPSEPCTRGQIVTFLYRAYK